MPIIDVDQRSDEWLVMRRGCVTASRVHVLMKRVYKTKANPDGKYSGERETYKWDVITERLASAATNHHITEAMQWGIDHEQEARMEYEKETGRDVRRGKMAAHDSIRWFSASADGLIGKDGGFEAKCLTSREHLEIARTGCVPEEYIWQCRANMSCYNRQWWDFMSYDPRLAKEGMDKFIRRIERDETIRQMEDEIVKFLKEVEEQLALLHDKKPLMLKSTLLEQLEAMKG